VNEHKKRSEDNDLCCKSCRANIIVGICQLLLQRSFRRLCGTCKLDFISRIVSIYPYFCAQNDPLESTPCAKAIKTIFHFSQTATSTDNSIARQKFKIRWLEPRLSTVMAQCTSMSGGKGFTPRCAVTEEHKLVWTNRNKVSTVDVLDVHY
jgi:hypothetical protein